MITYYKKKKLKIKDTYKICKLTEKIIRFNFILIDVIKLYE